MKCKVKGKDLIAAVKTVVSVHDLGDGKDARQPCLLTVKDDQLTIESARLGAYIVKTIPCTPLRPGSVGLNAKDLKDMKVSGDVTADGDKDTTVFTDRSTKYQWANDDQAESEIVEQRESLSQVKPVAKIPATLMRAGSTFAAYKSETGDYDVQVTIAPKRFEYIGLDYLGSARYEFLGDAVRAKAETHFTLGTALIGKAMKHIAAEDMMVGISDDGSTVRFKTPDLDFFHPAIDKKYMSSKKMIAAVTKAPGSKCICEFTVERKEFNNALDRVLKVGKKGSEADLKIVVDKERGVLLNLSVQDNAASSKVQVSGLKVGKKPITLIVRTQYLQEFLRAAPDVQLKVQSWNGKFLRMTVSEEKSFIDYMAMMIAD